MNVFLWYRWRGALPPDPSSVVWHTVRLASLHCRYLAATNLPPLPNVWLVNHSGGCSLFGLLKLQTVHARPTSPGHLYPPLPPPPRCVLEFYFRFSVFVACAMWLCTRVCTSETGKKITTQGDKMTKMFAVCVQVILSAQKVMLTLQD